MRRYLFYLKYVIRHKWFVLVEGRKLHVPIWQLLIHDWDKFIPALFINYAKCFYESDGSSRYKEEYLIASWNAHQKRNKHHWQYWILVWDNGNADYLPIPDVHRREMLADWRGAGRAVGKPDTREWYKKNASKIKIHPDTRRWIEKQLDINWRDFVVNVREFE